MSRAPTLEDVARAAGVSRATASRVVRGDVRVTEPRAAAVQRAIRDLGYVPNIAARSLVTRSTGAIALIVPEPDTRVFSDPFFGTAVAAITARLAASDRQLILVMSGTAGGPGRLRRFLGGGHADGVIVMSHHEGDPELAALDEASVPVVHLGRPPSGSAALWVDVDNVEGGRIAARVLLERGCTRLALIGGPDDMAAAIDRRAGFEEVVRAEGAEVAGIEVADFTVAGGEAAAERLLRGATLPDGVFAANDLMAIGALRCLRPRGVRVPADVALVGFDDIALSAEELNALTTVANPVTTLGTTAASVLLDAVEGLGPASVLLPDLRLVRRATA